MKAISVHKYGGPEVLSYEDAEIPKPGKGEVLVRIAATGVNYIDIYQRTGLYSGNLPFTPGMEASGIVDEVGQEIANVKKGDSVAYASQLGSYSEYAVVPAWKLVHVPDGIDAQSAAAAMLQGMTAHYLTHSTYPLKKGSVALVHAAAGGVGRLLVQMAKNIGAYVIGTVSTEEKARIAEEAGADDVIIYTQVDFEEEVKKITNGKGVDVVYDGVGKATLEKGMRCLKPRGYMVLFGQASGPAPLLDLGLLSRASLFLTRPSLGYYTSTREELLQRATAVFDWIISGKVKLRIEKALPLREAAEAHKLLEERKTSGKLLLIP